MGGSDYVQAGNRIGKDGISSITWQSSCGIDVVDYTKADQAIIAAILTSSAHTPPLTSFQLRWRNFTDNPSGSFIAFTTSGELQRGVSAGCISNTDPVADPSACAGTVDASEEVENESPLQSASLSCAKNNYIELQFCVDFSNALDGKEYEFELYDMTEGASCGTLAATITVYSEPPAEADEIISKLNENVNQMINNGLN